MTDPRAARIAAFIAAGPFAGATGAPLAGDASMRRYDRLHHPALGTAVLMDAPPDRGEDVRPFVDITDRLRSAGFTAPAILQADEAAGLLLLEDLGDALFARVLAAGEADEPTLYAAAVDLLADLQTRADLAAGLPPYDLAFYRTEAAIMSQWYLGTGTRADTYLDLVTAACEPLTRTPPVIVLRDYHAENLIWRPGLPGHARVGLLDYQGAMAGHPAYDLVSLLEDARRDTSRTLRETMFARFRAARPVPDLETACATLGAQRNLKILGIFARLWLRDGRPGYLDLMPRVWDHLRRDLAHPALSDLRAWVETHVPPPDAATRARLLAAR